MSEHGQIRILEREIRQLEHDLEKVKYTVTYNMIHTVINNKKIYLAELKERVG